MKIEELTREVLLKLRLVRYDRFIEKHEGPWSYQDWPGVEDIEFLLAAGSWILLPVDRDNHSGISFGRVIESRDGEMLTIFGRNTTFVEPSNTFDGYFLAVCEKFPGEEFFVATLYHDRYFVEPLRD